MRNTFYVRTFGCQMNDHDSERIAGLLEEMGLRPVDSPEDGDVLVYNTCSIREKADTRLLGHLGAARRLKALDPGRVVVVAGCLAQSRREAFFAEHPYVDVLVGPQSLHLLPSLVEGSRSGAGKVGAFEESTTHWSAELPRARCRGAQAWIQIMAGCSNYCSYCIVPYVRGPEASRPESDILAEVAGLMETGVREITLLGQNVNAYGLEPGFGGRSDFAALLRSLAELEGRDRIRLDRIRLDRIRFMTSHPKDVSDGLIEAMADLQPVCEHLHLPVQSGSDRVLRAMRRGYDRAEYLDLVRRLRRAVPGIALTTDVIIGFPGETDEDFEETLDLVETVGYDAAFTFQYSPRRQTAAAELPGRVEQEVLESRMRRLVELTQGWGARRNAALVGREVEVLVEGRSRRGDDLGMGRTRTYKTVNFRGDAEPGELVVVRVEESSSTSLRGDVLRRHREPGMAAGGDVKGCPAS
ncbi:MAG: tRNA (N6-isopentenyl adenosine(37)-C2)-methylthiotransferase MiaB [Thermoleophilia bacterium]